MSKNLTRKGLALGAVVALGSSLFAGTPATAAPSALFLESAFGTSLEGVLGQNFVLSSTAAGAADGDDVSYYIEGVTAANLTVVGRYTTALSTTTTGNVYSSAADANGEAIKLVTTDKGLILLQDTDAAAKVATVKVDTWQSGAALQFALKVNATNVTATTAVKVTPFLDNVLADGIPGANELKGTAVTVNFNKASELTATPTLQAIALGSNVKANVAVTKVNLEQFRAATEGAPAAQDFVNVDFTSNGAAFQSDKAPVWNTTDKLFVVDSTGTPTAGNVYGATAQFGSTDSASAALVTAAAGEVSALGAFAVTKGTSYRASVSSSDHVVRSGSGAVSIATTATVVTGKAKAGQKVTFKIAESGNSTLDSAATVTAGGKTLANAKSGTTEDVSVEVATDADGKATLAISYAGIKDGNQFVVSATAAGASGSVAVSTNRTFTGKDSVATAIVDNSAAVSGGTSVRQVAKGSALSIDYTLVDQFGQAPVGDFQLVISENSSSANFTANVPVSAGKATFSGSDNSTADNNYTLTATVQKKNTSGNWEAIGSGLSRTSAIQIAAVGTPSSITVTAGATTGVTRDAVTYVAGNTDIEQDTVTRTAPSNGTTLTGTVVGASGAVVDGATVTFTGANLLFKAGNVYGVGSITVRTDASGAYDTINVYSNKAGKQTVTITSGGASKTQDITFAAVTTGGKTWTSNAAARVLPGTTLKVTGTLTDAYGNAVDVASGITVAYTGPGFLTATPATQTDENGAVSATVLLGAADTGSAVFKFTYDNGTSSDDTDDVVFTSTVAIGAAPVAGATAAIAGSTKRFFVSVDGNSSARNVVVKVAGKTFRTLKGSTAKKTYVVAAPKGSHKVTVFVGGKLIATKTISVK